jgi:DNA repair exonuclease SbcCD nuclease subunit
MYSLWSQSVKNILIFTDPHLKEKHLQECKLIFDEIISIAQEYQVDTVFDAGDTFDQVNPLPCEQDLFSLFITKLNRSLIVVAAQSHESLTREESVLNHYAILNNDVSVVKDWTDDRMFVGHFMVNEAKLKGGTVTKCELAKYKYVFLGHEHVSEFIKPNIWQLPSARYVNFNEASESFKWVMVLKNYNTPEEELIKVPLKTPYKMYEFEVRRDIQGLWCRLDELSANSKVKVKIYRYVDFKDFILREKEYRLKFDTFVYENKFDLIENKTQVTKQSSNIVELFDNYSKDKKIDNEIIDIIKPRLQ